MDKKSIVPKDLEAYYTHWHFSPAIISGGFAFFSGCTGTDADGTNSSSPEEQIRQAFRKIELSLTKAGLTFDDVVEMTSYHVGLRDQLSDFRRVKDEFIGEPYPAWTAIGISELAVEGALVEIRIIARVQGP